MSDKQSVGVHATAVWYVLGLLYFAMSGGKKAH